MARRALLLGIAWILMLVSSGCKQGVDASGQGLGPRGADPGPTLKVVPGAIEPKLEAPIELQADAIASLAGHFYLSAPLPSDLDRVEPLDLHLEGPRHGLAALGRSRLLVRLQGAEPPAGPIQLVVRQRPAAWSDSQDQGAQTILRPLTVLTPAGLAGQSGGPELEQVFFEALAEQFTLRAHGWQSVQDGFAAFAEGRARVLAGRTGAKAAGRDWPRPARKSDLGEMMSLYTGMSSVQEALQADRGLLQRGGDAAQRTIPVASIAGVGLAQHPWDELLQGQQPTLEPLASRVPQDTLYVHFRDLRTFVELTRELDELGTPLQQIFENQPGDYGLGPRYEEELMLERLGLAEKLGHLASSGVALLLGDPFLREGADLAVLFQVKDRALLLSALDFYELRARKAHPDLETRTLNVQGYEVRLTSTPDGAVRQHRVEQDGLLLLSNSPAGLERVLKVWRGESQPLATSGDFRYLRSLYPPTEDPREAFVFLPDAFIARAVSPTTKIAAARRMQAQADLLAVGYAALLHGWLEGAAPARVEDLLTSGTLRPSDLQDEDGRPIAFDPARGASSIFWGRPCALRPLADVAVDLVSQEEQAAYERFRETYQSYWRRYLDPVAARVRWLEEGGGLDVDVRILPLIENSDYDELVERAGKTTVGPPVLRGAFQWTFAVGEQASLRKDLDQVGRGFLPGQQTVLGWLGDWVMAGTLDHSGLWDVAMLGEAIPTSKLDKPDGTRSLWEALPRVPLYAGAQVRHKGALAALLIALKTKAEEAAPGLVRWAPSSAYRDVPLVEIASVDEKTSGPGAMPKVSVFYATVEDVFVVGLGRATVEALIDARLDGMLPVSGKGDGQAHVDLASLGPDSWLTLTGLGLMEHGVRSATRQALRGLETLARGLGGLPADPAARRAAALGYLGFEPACPQGGAFVQDGARGRISHPVYGSLSRPLYPALPVPDAPATRVLRSLQSLHMQLAFEGEGKSRGLRAVMSLRRRPGIR